MIGGVFFARDELPKIGRGVKGVGSALRPRLWGAATLSKAGPERGGERAVGALRAGEEEVRKVSLSFSRGAPHFPPSEMLRLSVVAAGLAAAAAQGDGRFPAPGKHGSPWDPKYAAQAAALLAQMTLAVSSGEPELRTLEAYSAARGKRIARIPSDSECHEACY
jgi:hypothetical protein